MVEWKEVTIDELFTVQNGFAFKSSDYVEENDKCLEVLKMGHIERGGGLRKDPKKSYIPRSEYLDRWVLDKNDIVMAMTDMKDNVVILGVPAIIDKDNHYVLNQRVARLKLKRKDIADIYFLYNYLKWKEFLFELQSKANSGVQVNLSTTTIKESIISIPPLPEQKAIASVLSSLDDKIDLLHRQNKTLEAMAETLFRQWFVEEAEEDWEEKPISEVVKIAIGRTPPRKEFHWFSTNSSDIKWVSIKDMGQSGIFIFDTSEYLTKEAVKTFNIPTIPIDTVLLSFKMTVGRVGITTETMLSNEAIAHFIFDENTPFSKEYLYFFLKTFKYDSLGSTSSIVTAINSSIIKEIKIVIPDKMTMKKFRVMTEKLFNKIKQNQFQIRTLEKLRDTLLPKLMSGEMRVEI